MSFSMSMTAQLANATACLLVALLCYRSGAYRLAKFALVVAALFLAYGLLFHSSLPDLVSRLFAVAGTHAASLFGMLFNNLLDTAFGSASAGPLF